MRTCTWAPSVFQGTQVVGGKRARAADPFPDPSHLNRIVDGYVQRVESLGVSHLLIAQRWWGSGTDIEGSSLDCLAMTAHIAARTERLRLVTAIHPGFFSPAQIAKWGATLDRLSGGRWAINLTSGWNLDEFAMYGVDPLSHDERYARSDEFLTVLKAAWAGGPVTHSGRYYSVSNLVMEPPPTGPLEVFQGGQSPAALELAARHTDTMFLNGGSLEKIAAIIERARTAAAETGRELRFALYAAPLCRDSDATAWAEIDARLARVDPDLVARRRERVSGAEGMWSGTDDPLTVLDTNEGYASRLIGSPETILEKIEAFRAIGIDMLHLDLGDDLFNTEVLPIVHNL